MMPLERSCHCEQTMSPVTKAEQENQDEDEVEDAYWEHLDIYCP